MTVVQIIRKCSGKRSFQFSQLDMRLHCRDKRYLKHQQNGGREYAWGENGLKQNKKKEVTGILHFMRSSN